MKKELIGVETIENEINIHFFLTNDCNFLCPYCISKDRGNDYVDLKKVFEVQKFILNLLRKYKKKKITLVITGGEPTIHKNIMKAIDIFLSISDNRLTVSVLTNGSVLYKKEKDLKRLLSKNYKSNLDFNVSYHYFDNNKKYDCNFIKTIILLQKLKINFDLNYLVPYRKTANFSIKLIKNLKEKIGDVYINYILVSEYSIIKEKNPRNKKYNKGHYDLALRNTKISKKKLQLFFKDGDNLLVNAKYIIKNNLDNFLGWKCYPFKSLITMIISVDCKVSIAGCHSFTKEGYSFDNILKMMDNKDFYIHCGSKICRASMNYGLKKERDKDFLLNIDIEEKLRNIVHKNLKINGYEFQKIKYINNGFNIFSIIFMYKDINSPENILYIGIDKIFKENDNYILKYKGFGVHYSFRTIKGRYIKSDKIKLTNILQDNIFKKIKLIIEVLIYLLSK